MQYGKEQRARTVWRASDVTNPDLLAIVTAVANRYASEIAWPGVLDPADAARIAWQAVRDNTRYYPDRAAQFIRTPAGLVRERIGDCKTTAAFIAAVCAAAGRDVALKFVKLPGRSHYGHVYAVVDGQPVDPLLPFGTECIYSAAHTEPVSMEARVMNGWDSGSAVTFSAGTGARNLADLYERALAILEAPEMTGATEYGQAVQAAQTIARFVDRQYPDCTWEQLECVQCMGSLWEDLHKATTNVTREMDWLVDAQRINPLLIPVRAALLELTKANIGGLADMFSKANQAVLKGQWEANGGKWNELTKAMSQGRGKKGDEVPPPPGPMNGTPADLDWWVDLANFRAMNGPEDVYYMPGGNPNPTATPPPSQSTPPIQSGGGGGSTWNSIWDIAGPLVNSLLGSAAGAAGQAITNAISPKPPQPPQPPQPPPTQPRVTTRVQYSPERLAAIRAHNAKMARERAEKLRKEKTNRALLIGGGALALLAASGAFNSRRNG